jgi:thiol:disulfide interchange protein DsbA
MVMKRREFSLGLVTCSWGAIALPGAVLSQEGTPIEGKHYARITPPAPGGAPGKIEVVEFFWYGCPHCYAFEPQLEAWIKLLPNDISFRRVPVAFRQDPFVAHQKLYFSLESLGLVEKLQRKVFDEIHSSDQGKKTKLSNLNEIIEFLAKQGVDQAQFSAVFNSFAISTKLSQAEKLVKAYQINGVPSIGIHGQFLTDGPMAGGMDKALRVTDFLIQKIRSKA